MLCILVRAVLFSNTLRTTKIRIFWYKFAMTLGNRIRKKRKEKGWTQEELASACNFDGKQSGGQSRIGHYERGVRTPSTNDINAIARALDVDPGWLAYGNIVSMSENTVKVPLLERGEIRFWLNGKPFPRSIKTLLSVSEQAFCCRITDPAADGLVPYGAIGLFDPGEVDNLSAYKLALIYHNGEHAVKQITYDSGVLFFTGGLVTIQGSSAKVLAPLISLPETPISSNSQ